MTIFINCTLMLIIGLSMAYWSAIRAKYRRFNDWCTSSGIMGAIVYAGVCGSLVWIVSYSLGL